MMCRSPRMFLREEVIDIVEMYYSGLIEKKKLVEVTEKPNVQLEVVLKNPSI